MNVLATLEPQEVFRYFEQISSVPRSTFHDEKISAYCAEFAQAHNLEYYQDSLHNIIIKKPGTEGYETSEPVILQGHLDMVAVKTEDSDHNFDTDPLELFIENGLVGARNTSLGADNGIALAYALAILASKDIPHPPIEAVFTADEEIGMGGAYALDMTKLKGRKCLNIDSEEEGVFTVGCSGGFLDDVFHPITWDETTGTKIILALSGLTGGHSGVEIQMQHGNAHKIMGRILYTLAKNYTFRLIRINGGFAANAIAQDNTAVLVVDSTQAESFIESLSQLFAIISEEFMGQEPDLALDITTEEMGSFKTFDAATTNHVVTFLNGAPDGVQCYDRSFPTAVETSLNTGIVETTEEAVRVRYQIRSAFKSKLDEMKDRMHMWCELTGATYELSSGYPSWAFDPDSRLRPLVIEVYKEMFGEEPRVETTHGGLECGILYSKKPDLDIISIGPNLLDVHSTKERLDIASTAKYWEFIKAILKACK